MATLAIIRKMGLARACAVSGLVLLGLHGDFILSRALFGFLIDIAGAYHFGWGLAGMHFVATSFLAVAWRRARVVHTGAL